MTETLKNFVIGVLIFSFVLVGAVFMISDINTNYDINTSTDDFNETYDQIDETFDMSEDIKDSTLYGEVEGSDQSWESLVKNSYGSFKVVASGFGLVGNIISKLSITLGVPRFVVTFTLTAISVLLMFAMIAMIFRFRG